MIATIMKPFFISIPHSGERVPPDAAWLDGLPESVLMCDVDRFVDRLYAPVVGDLKLPCVIAPWHRYAVDLNRLPDDVDRDSVLNHPNPSGEFSRGLHWVKTTRGNRLMPEPISDELHQKLVRQYYLPFHVEILRVYADFETRGASEVYHLDAHSMPSVGTVEHRDPGQVRADVVVSDDGGRSCSARFKDLVIGAYGAAGLEVAYNWPYTGGRVTQTYGEPHRGHHAIQVELNRALYMDEATRQPVAERMAALIKSLAAVVRTIHAGLGET